MSETPRTAVEEQTEVGSYFVANYPPFSVWTKDDVERVAKPALDTAPAAGVPLGLYLHIPFCRKRCHFCYFRVYTDKNSQEIEDYLDVLVREMELYARLPAIGSRKLNFAYFGGGTPSFLSTRQLEGLVSRLTSIMPWEDAEENNFDRLVDDIARRNELMLSYDGRGVLCRINDATPSGAALVGVDSPGGVTGTTFGNRFIQPSTYIAAINPATGGIRAGISLVASNTSDGTGVTFAATVRASPVDSVFACSMAPRGMLST